MMSFIRKFNQYLHYFFENLISFDMFSSWFRAIKKKHIWFALISISVQFLIDDYPYPSKPSKYCHYKLQSIVYINIFIFASTSCSNIIDFIRQTHILSLPHAWESCHNRIYWKDIILDPVEFGMRKSSLDAKQTLWALRHRILNPISIVVVNIHEIFCILCTRISITPTTTHPDNVGVFSRANNYTQNILYDSKKVRWEVWFVEERRNHNET